MLADRSRREGQTEAPARSAPPSPAPADPLHAGILALQAGVGNRAVARSAAGASEQVLARKAKEYGLRNKVMRSPFAKAAMAFWHDPANKDKPLKAYADELMAKANASLKTLGSFECRYSINGTGSDSGSFSRVTWNVTINPAKFSDRHGITKVGELTADEAAEVADTIYHEVRHSEQYFRIARMQAGRSTKATPAEIAAEIKTNLSIPPDVATAAAGKPIKDDKTHHAELAEVKDWESITVGIHATYKGVINTWMGEAEEALDLTTGLDATKVDAAKAGIAAHIAAWGGANRKTFAADHLKDTLATKQRSTMDKLVIKNLTAIKSALAGVEKAWKHVTDGWAAADPDERIALVRSMRPSLSKLYNAIYAAYRDHIHETDAWATGGAVGKEFRAEAKKAAKKKPVKVP